MYKTNKMAGSTHCTAHNADFELKFNWKSAGPEVLDNLFYKVRLTLPLALVLSLSLVAVCSSTTTLAIQPAAAGWQQHRAQPAAQTGMRSATAAGRSRVERV